MIARAKIRFLKTSAQKARLVVNQIRGRPVGEALALLGVSEKIVAKDWVETPKVAVEPDSTYYVVDEKPERGQPSPPADKERMPIQIHRWISRMLTSPTPVSRVARE